MIKTGILGGTFNPVHRAHLDLAFNSALEFRLDKVLLMPALNPPHKELSFNISFDTRTTMLRLALDDYIKIRPEAKNIIKISTFEAEVPDSSYSCDVLKSYKETYPDEDLYFIIGGDSLFKLQYWYKPEEILSLVKIVAAYRPDSDETINQIKNTVPKELTDKISELKELFNAEIYSLIVNYMNISSTEIRELAKKGLDMSALTFNSVSDYILKNGLYR